MALQHPFILTLVVVGVAVVLLSFLPLPWFGVNDYNVVVTTTLSETCVVGFCSYGVSTIGAHTTGGSTVIDWGGWFGFGFAAPCINCQYKLVVAFSNGGPSASAQESKFISNLFSINQQDTVTMNFAYVVQGSYVVSANLYLNGANVATGSQSICAGPGC